MFATTFLPPAVLRVSNVIYALFQKFLMVAGLVFVTGLIGLQTGNAGWLDGLKTLMPSANASVAEDGDVAPLAARDETVSLSPRMLGALDYVSRRYHVSTDALQPIFATAQSAGEQWHIDPLLIIAVIGIVVHWQPPGALTGAPASNGMRALLWLTALSARRRYSSQSSMPLKVVT